MSKGKLKGTHIIVHYATFPEACPVCRKPLPVDGACDRCRVGYKERGKHEGVNLGYSVDVNGLTENEQLFAGYAIKNAEVDKVCMRINYE